MDIGPDLQGGGSSVQRVEHPLQAGMDMNNAKAAYKHPMVDTKDKASTKKYSGKLGHESSNNMVNTAQDTQTVPEEPGEQYVGVRVAVKCIPTTILTGQNGQ